MEMTRVSKLFSSFQSFFYFFTLKIQKIYFASIKNIIGFKIVFDFFQNQKGFFSPFISIILDPFMCSKYIF